MKHQHFLQTPPAPREWRALAAPKLDEKLTALAPAWGLINSFTPIECNQPRPLVKTLFHAKPQWRKIAC
jgi:hypothetical protein